MTYCDKKHNKTCPVRKLIRRNEVVCKNTRYAPGLTPDPEFSSSLVCVLRVVVGPAISPWRSVSLFDRFRDILSLWPTRPNTLSRLQISLKATSHSGAFFPEQFPDSLRTLDGTRLLPALFHPHPLAEQGLLRVTDISYQRENVIRQCSLSLPLGRLEQDKYLIFTYILSAELNRTSPSFFVGFGLIFEVKVASSVTRLKYICGDLFSCSFFN